MHSDKPTGTSVRQVLHVVPFAISPTSEVIHSLCRQPKTQTRWLAHHQTIWSAKKKNPTHTWTDSQCTHSPRIQLMFLQCRQLWVIPIQQQQEVKTSQGDPLLCSYSWLLALSLFSCWWATTVAMGGAKTDISFAVCSHLLPWVSQCNHRVTDLGGMHLQLSSLLWSIFCISERALILLRGGKMCHPAQIGLIMLG